MKIKKGDSVQMLGGKDRGKVAKVTKALPREERVVLEGLNILKKHRRAQQQGQKGQVIEFPRAVPASRVQLMCPQCGKPTRVGYHIGDAGQKSRRCSKCDATFV